VPGDGRDVATPRGRWSRLAKAADEALTAAGPRRVAMAAAIAALAVRTGWLLVRATPLDGDEKGYLRLAENLARHFRFALGPDARLEAHFGPLYSGLQALLVATGIPSAHAGWIVSLLAGSLVVGLVYRLGLALWSRPSAACAASATAVLHPALVSASTHIYPEALFSLLLVLSALSLAVSRRPGLHCGIGLGLAALTRREAVMLLPFAVAFLLLRRPAEVGGGPRRSGLRDAVILIAALVALFGPYVVYVRVASGHWTLSNKTNYSWMLGRLIEDRPGEGIPLDDVRRLEAAYGTPVAYVRAQPWKACAALATSASKHLAWAFTGCRSAPIGIAALAGLAVVLATRRLRTRQLAVILVPFVLVAAWAVAGPLERYSKALGPFVCLLVGGLVAGIFGEPSAVDAFSEGPALSPPERRRSGS
jgi:hypothetical protein